MGGWGEEREISVKTGEAIATALETTGHEVTRVFAGPGLDKALRSAQIDVAFLALHGRMGEDGKVQGLLEVLGIPYTGSGVLASALAMNKPFAKKLFRQHNLATPLGYSVRRADCEGALDLHLDLGFPCVVKPAHGGSSVGLSVVLGADQLVPAISHACRFGGEALVERMVKGREVTVGVLGDTVLGSCEISYPGSTFDYQTKYQSGGARYHLPPRLSATRVTNVEAMALAAYRALGCRGWGRADLMRRASDHKPFLLEMNTSPGMTTHSLVPISARAAGISYEQLCVDLLAAASLDATPTRHLPSGAKA